MNPEQAMRNGQRPHPGGQYRVLVGRAGEKDVRQIDCYAYNVALNHFLEEARSKPETLIVLDIEERTATGHWRTRDHFSALEVRAGVRHREERTGRPPLSAAAARTVKERREALQRLVS